jgi:hypothetical protein
MAGMARKSLDAVAEFLGGIHGVAALRRSGKTPPHEKTKAGSSGGFGAGVRIRGGVRQIVNHQLKVTIY